MRRSHPSFRRKVHAPLTWWHEMRMPRAEREAARADRAAETQLRREHDNQQSLARHAAALEAESRRFGGGGAAGSGGTGGIGGVG